MFHLMEPFNDSTKSSCLLLNSLIIEIANISIRATIESLIHERKSNLVNLLHLQGSAVA
jgi:hypothetical protein